MKIIECDQGSPEWLMARLGKVTASCFGDALAQNRQKTGVGVTSLKYMRKLIAERLSGEVQDSYTNAVIDRGSEVEQEARDYYEKLNGVLVTQVGFVEYSEDVGASPDCLMGDDGMGEIKCPNSSTHIEYILADRLPTVYVPQVQGGMWVCERQWCDFVSFDPRVKQRPYFCKRVFRDEEYIKDLESKIAIFVAEMKRTIEKLIECPF